MTTAGERRARFRELHAGERLFVMPNPWDVGSAKLLAAAGFEALATTSAGFAWALGKLDQTVTRDELVAHVAELASATDLPLNVDSERCYPDDPGGVAETVAQLAGAGAAGFSIEDYDPAAGGMDEIGVAAERVAAAAEANRALSEPMVLTARAENHIRSVDDLDDTIARLLAYRDAGADALYAPGLTDLGQIERVVAAVELPLNVLVLPGGPTVSELEGRRRAPRLDGKPARRNRVRCARRGGGQAADGRHRPARGRPRPARDAPHRPRRLAAAARRRARARSPGARGPRGSAAPTRPSRSSTCRRHGG
jgi:2-methylisocitrate lyase-like PEP mutase family enzyme